MPIKQSPFRGKSRKSLIPDDMFQITSIVCVQRNDNNQNRKPNSNLPLNSSLAACGQSWKKQSFMVVLLISKFQQRKK